ncbi:MAG: diaminobutyrate--2-oxoglutarate transaminase [Alphaproteobacteria bacterium]|nr:diaminobutyrate--2-oxoglutarate transaminase [Alphaproteobacteria bacterium]MBU1550119.1 diaminobutyrate--2-oxoglutarate transaminase [Alphaproteobacteria bacterium]MBU2337079.1 diaminobutyrate--2-oxoglutarate transaminase [Alphaproteobacteria bacterium]MBU2389410.1 diaminobutyrate--2-oxoglutarate transaminase [Alphaproteobacteria bacterium]
MSIHVAARNDDVYDRLESSVRSYCRDYPRSFAKASGSTLFTEEGDEYLDLLAGCGALNYGHNHPRLKEELMAYVMADGLAMGLDLHSQAKSRFLEAFERCVLAPRSLDYRVQFCGPTGANAIEAAIKLARKATGRRNVLAFTNGFHGCSLGALSLTANGHHRAASRSLLDGVVRVPFDGYLGKGVDTALYIEKLLRDPSGGVDPPAAIVMEVVQGEGGLNEAGKEWAASISRLADEVGAVLIVDEIQTGCGRTGTFFAFERIGIRPGIVTLAKSLSGFGLPLAAVLVRPDLDVWKPGEHNGTFRGNCHAFITAAAALETFWKDDALTKRIARSSAFLASELEKIAGRKGARVRGVGMMIGLDFGSSEVAAAVKRKCFDNRLVVENCGPSDEVLKLLPPLNILESDLKRAVSIISDAVDAV